MKAPTQQQLNDPAWWDGEGLPPVGCECEYQSDKGPLSLDECTLDKHCIVDTWWSGDRLTVIAHVRMPFGHDFIDVPVVQNERNYQVSTILSSYIRPIRTQAERERDELVSIMKRTREGAVAGDVLGLCAGAIIAAGYRKGDS
ncbi:hypothetical protein [Marinobacter salarius]|nr:hypothetical protein [Marinobacter salarius]